MPNQLPKNSITKEEINHLPLIQFEQKIILVSQPSEVSKALKALEGEEVLGFDTESRPSFSRHESYKPALLQLSSASVACLFRLNLLGLCPEFTALLEDKKILKIGVAIHDDIRLLKQLSPFEAENFIDLGLVAKHLEIKTSGLRSLTGLFLGRRLSKGAKLTNWEAPKLTKVQLTYAATDAWISRELYLHLKNRNMIPEAALSKRLKKDH